MSEILIEKLIGLGSEKLDAHFAYLNHGEHEAAHYYKGAFQALKEAASSLFGIDHSEFRSICIFQRDILKETGDIAAWQSTLYWNCTCADKYIHKIEIDKCTICGAERDDMPDSLLLEVADGSHFAE